MGTQSIVHGRIMLRGDFEKAAEFIKSLGDDEVFPWMRAEMFNICSTKFPFYYNEPVITFGATYKAVEFHWTDLILKFEHILRNLNFDTAKIQLETEYLGTYNFFWRCKTGTEKFNQEDKLIETDEWFFGYGNRNRWGLLDSPLTEEQIFSIDFQYPMIK